MCNETNSTSATSNGDGNSSIPSNDDLVDDYYLPAEWAPHHACLMLYPHSPFTFRLPHARDEFLQIAQAIAVEGEEPVILFCSTQEEADMVQEEADMVQEKAQTLSPNITTLVCPSDDSWARDMGPTFVVSRHHHNNNNQQEQRRIVGIDWDFNAWGGPKEGCYWPCEQDKLVAKRMCEELNKVASFLSSHQLQTKKVPLILEGGSIHVDGEGTILTTKECLLNPNRNPTKTQQEIQNMICQALGATKIIWLPYGVDGDEDTNGHIDNFACFAKPGHIILSWTNDNVHDKINYERCREALQILQEETDAQGRSLTIHKLQLPPPMFYAPEEADSLDLVNGEPPRKAGERMAGSYVNFYIANKAIIVPQFGHSSTDHNAIETLAAIFPDRKVVGVHSKEVLIGGGNIHCITQQLPTFPS